MGSSSLTSDVFTGAWSQLLIGVRIQLEITVLRERSADVGAYELLAWARMDVAVARPAASLAAPAHAGPPVTDDRAEA